MKCEDITGNKIKIGKVRKTSKFDIPYYITDNNKFYKFYKWKSKNNLNKILKDILIWLKNNKKIRKYFL